MNNKGFSLIEVMLAMGVMSVVALGTVQMLEHTILISNTAEAKSNVTAVVASAAGVANNVVSCTAALTKVSQTLTDTIQFDTLKAGAVLPDYRLTVKSVKLVNTVLSDTGYDGTKVYKADIQATFASNRPVYGGQTFAPRTVSSVYITVAPLGVIVACGSVLPELVKTLPIEVPKVSDEDVYQAKRGCNAIGGEYSNGNCSLHSRDNDHDIGHDCDGR